MVFDSVRKSVQTTSKHKYNENQMIPQMSIPNPYGIMERKNNSNKTRF